MTKLGFKEEKNLRYRIALILHTLPKYLYIAGVETDSFDRRVVLVTYKNYRTYKVTLDGNCVEEMSVVV